MKGIHPKTTGGATCCLVIALFAMGCRSTSSGVNNAFMAPDRVAPPSTRALAPGQAQPYYQGDPLPTMQSSTSVAPMGPLAADAAAARSATGQTLAWNVPGSSSPTAPAAAPPPWGVSPQASTPVARTNESAVSVPTDTNTLRFALPASAAAQTAGGPAASSAAGPQSSLTPAPANNQGVALASYNTPAPNGLTPVATAPSLSPTPQAASPWRSPQAGGSSVPVPGYTQPSSPAYANAQTPVVMPTNQMAVQLRAVPSPSQPGDPIPRVRIPGYDVPETASSDNFHARTSMR